MDSANGSKAIQCISLCHFIHLGLIGQGRKFFCPGHLAGQNARLPWGPVISAGTQFVPPT